MHHDDEKILSLFVTICPDRVHYSRCVCEVVFQRIRSGSRKYVYTTHVAM